MRIRTFRRRNMLYHFLIRELITEAGVQIYIDHGVLWRFEMNVLSQYQLLGKRQLYILRKSDMSGNTAATTV